MTSSIEQHAAGMPGIGDGLNAQLVALWTDPTVERCEAVAANLAGARLAVLRLREALMAQAAPFACANSRVPEGAKREFPSASTVKPALLASDKPVPDDRQGFADTERGHGQ